MKFYKINPPGILSQYVRFYWVLECEVEVGQEYIHRTTADGCTELIFHYNGRFEELYGNNEKEYCFVSGFHGQSSKFRRFRIDKSFGIFGVYLYPFTLPNLFRVSASAMADQMVDLRDLLGQGGDELEERIMLAGDNEKRSGIISQFLLSRLFNRKNGNQHVCSSIKTMIDKNGQVDLPSFVSQYCLSTRQFERKFKEYSGFSPKRYSRILRFQSVFPELSTRNSTLTEIAMKCGYYDQSHFINDFREFSGFSPGQYLNGDSSETMIWTDN